MFTKNFNFIGSPRNEILTLLHSSIYRSWGHPTRNASWAKPNPGCSDSVVIAVRWNCKLNTSKYQHLYSATPQGLIWTVKPSISIHSAKPLKILGSKRVTNTTHQRLASYAKLKNRGSPLPMSVTSCFIQSCRNEGYESDKWNLRVICCL